MELHAAEAIMGKAGIIGMAGGWFRQGGCVGAHRPRKLRSAVERAAW